jgi:hypothetical protein
MGADHNDREAVKLETLSSSAPTVVLVASLPVLYALANPHDQQAHNELVKIFNAKYAFRAEMEEEDGEWLRNNPTDFETEIQMRSIATVAIYDPEYAISTDRFILSRVHR